MNKEIYIYGNNFIAKIKVIRKTDNVNASVHKHTHTQNNNEIHSMIDSFNQMKWTSQ